MDLDDLAGVYRGALFDDVIPFWLRHGLDREFGGFLSILDRDGSVVDTDKSVWIQGRAAWMLATLHSDVEQRGEWLEAARSAIEFLRCHCRAPSGKLCFTVTREGRPLRMRRYAYSEAFSSMGNAAFARAAGDGRAAEDAVRDCAAFLRHNFTPGLMTSKTDSETRPMKGIAPRMIAIVVAQELRSALGDIEVEGRTCTEHIDLSIGEIERDFLKPDEEAVLEVVGPRGEILDCAEGRTLNPGHAIEAAWFILEEGRLRLDSRLLRTGLAMLDWTWKRGWDEEHGGIFYFRDLWDRPVQEYWHDMKFWWPHTEAITATLHALRLGGSDRYARWHEEVHRWSFARFPDPEYGEWYGYLHRDGRVSVPLKGSLWKGPFHLPRMLWHGWRLTSRAEGGLAGTSSETEE